jgi:hypothetical protein
MNLFSWGGCTESSAADESSTVKFAARTHAKACHKNGGTLIRWMLNWLMRQTYRLDESLTSGKPNVIRNRQTFLLQRRGH